MSFSGKFELSPSNRAVGIVLWTFELKCTNLFFDETIDFMLSDEFGTTPWYYENQKFKAGRTYRFDNDSVGWTWYQHDFFAIIDKNRNILKKWQLNLRVYGPGECPDCHGSGKCKYCHGKGFVWPKGQMYNLTPCTHCGGTGKCMRCDIPLRSYRSGGAPTGIGNGYK